MPQHNSSQTTPLAANQGVASAGNASLLLTVPEACQLLRVSRWSLCRLIQRNEISTIKIGSRRLVPRAAVQEFIRTRVNEVPS